MDDDKSVSRLSYPEELIGFFDRSFWQIEVNSARWIADPQRFEQGEMVINCVKQAHRSFDEFVVTPGSNLCPQVGVIRRDSLSRVGEKCQKRRAIVPGEIEA